MVTGDEIQHINDERRQRRAQLSKDVNQHINDEKRQIRSQLPEYEIQKMNEQSRHRRAQLPEDEILEMNEERRQRRSQLPEDDILLIRQQEQERLNNRNERSGGVPVRFVPQNNRELRFSYYGTRGFSNRMDTKFSACVSGILSTGNTDHMDASILDKMKYYDLGKIYPDAHHMDHSVNICPYCNALLFKSEKSSLCCRNGCVHLPPLPEYPEATWNLDFQNGTDGNFIRDNFRAINQPYAMASVNKEVERGTING
jgi:hypothetical protein